MPLEPQNSRLLCLAPKISRKINSLVRAVHQLTLVGIVTTTTKKLRDQSLLLMCTTTKKKEKKIAPKALFKRPEHILPDLIHYNQNEYVKVRSIFDAVRTIDDVLE